MFMNSSNETLSNQVLVQQIFAAFREELPDVTASLIDRWMDSPQPELDEMTPNEWVGAQSLGEADDMLLLAARRTAHLEAQ